MNSNNSDLSNSVNEDETAKINNYLSDLKNKLNNQNEQQVDSDDEKVKKYLSDLKSKLAVQDEQPPKNETSEDVRSYLDNLKKNLATNVPTVQNVGKDHFDNRVREYLSKNKVKLYVLTPCYGGLCHVNYINKIMETKEVLQSLGIKFVLQFIRNESLITRGRNNLTAKSMSDPEMTHILFIDSDITWEPIHIIKLIIADKELCGGIYPIKKYHWDRLTSENIQKIIQKKNLPYNQGLTETQLLYHNLLHYNFNHLPNANAIQNNLMEIYTLATGFMMIQRVCIEKMIKAFPQYKYTDDCGFLQGDENKFAYALFDCAIVNDHYFSEDWLFCHRWREIGGQIFVDITIDLWHTGQEDYSGRLISTLNIN
jgi:hypothetical protein